MCKLNQIMWLPILIWYYLRSQLNSLQYIVRGFNHLLVNITIFEEVIGWI